jgi:allophanate hydrolase
LSAGHRSAPRWSNSTSEPFYETARLLYEGRGVAERYLVIRDLLASSPDSIHPVTREITAAGSRLTAADTFAALYRLQVLRRIAERVFGDIDALVLPTAPTAYSTAQVLANPIELNSRLGTYTNFVNLLDLCGLALPAAMRPDGIPFGITLLAPAGHDAQLASIGRVFHADTRLKMGSRYLTQPPLATLHSELIGDEIADRRGRCPSLRHGAERRTCRRSAAACSRKPHRAGLQALCARHHAAETRHAARRARRGSSDQARAMGAVGGSFGKFVAAIPPPLRIGTIRLAMAAASRVSGRARGDQRRARYLALRRLARVHGGEGGVCPHGEEALAPSEP